MAITASKILDIKVQLSNLQGLADNVAKLQSDLNKTTKNLQDITTELEKTGSTVSKVFAKMKQGLNKFTDTIKKGIVGGLKTSVNLARNLVMALGAAAAAALAVSSGSIERKRQSKDSKVSATQLLAWQYAQQQTGLSENELNLANLQAHINDIESSGYFAKLGLTRENLVGLSGDEAMQKIIEAIQKKGGANMTADTWSAVGDAVSALAGVEGLNRMHIFSDKTQKEFGEHYKWGLANGIDNDKLVKGEQALNKFMFTLKKLGMELAGDFLPHISKGLEVFANALNKIRTYLKGKEGQNIINQLGSLISKIADFLGTIASLSLEGIGNYLLPALNGIVGFLGDLIKGDFGSAGGKLLNLGKSVKDWAMNDAGEMIGVEARKAYAFATGQEYKVGSGSTLPTEIGYLKNLLKQNKLEEAQLFRKNVENTNNIKIEIKQLPDGRFAVGDITRLKGS